MASDSQRNVDLETIRDFTELWQKTVIDGTSDAVRNSVTQAVQKLVAGAEAADSRNARHGQLIEEKLEKFERLGAQVESVISAGRGSTDAVTEMSRLVPGITEQLSGLQNQLTSISKGLEENQGWRKRLASWRQDRITHMALIELSEILHGQDVAKKGIAAGADDTLPPREQPNHKGAVVTGEDKPNPGKASRGKGLRAVALAATLVVAGAAGGFFAGTRTAAPTAGPVVATNVSSGADQTTDTIPAATIQSADVEWNRLRTDPAAKARLTGFCTTPPCEGDEVPQPEKFEMVWNGLLADKQHLLFGRIVEIANRASTLSAAQCAKLIARADLDRNAPEFVPQIGGCIVQQRYRRGAADIEGSELLSIAARILAFRNEARPATGAGDGAQPTADGNIAVTTAP